MGAKESIEKETKNDMVEKKAIACFNTGSFFGGIFNFNISKVIKDIEVEVNRWKYYEVLISGNVRYENSMGEYLDKKYSVCRRIESFEAEQWICMSIISMSNELMDTIKNDKIVIYKRIRDINKITFSSE